jgi:hypothetical protein
MQRIFFLMACFIISTSTITAQDTIKINGQPKWEKAMDIADYCLFYEETLNKALSFEQAKKQTFVPYTKELRKQKFSNRPLIIQWLKFTIKNTSSLDTINLSIYTVHYFTSLYNNTELLGLSGAYEEPDETEKKITTATFDRGRLPVIIPPNATVSYWFRTEDRQNQLIPPQILLETKFISMAEDIESGFSSRYLFLIMAAMVGCFVFATGT